MSDVLVEGIGMFHVLSIVNNHTGRVRDSVHVAALMMISESVCCAA